MVNDHSDLLYMSYLTYCPGYWNASSEIADEGHVACHIFLDNRRWCYMSLQCTVAMLCAIKPAIEDYLRLLAIDALQESPPVEEGYDEEVNGNLAGLTRLTKGSRLL